MSVKSWEAEYYPTPANSKEALADPVRHSLRKWEGLLLENLKKHGLDDDDSRLPIEVDDSTCALCHLWAHLECAGCPLFQAGYECDVDSNGPWAEWVNHYDPQPMINALKEVL